MRTLGGLLAALGLLTMSSCSTTSVASTPGTEPSTTVSSTEPVATTSAPSTTGVDPDTLEVDGTVSSSTDPGGSDPSTLSEQPSDSEPSTDSEPASTATPSTDVFDASVQANPAGESKAPAVPAADEGATATTEAAPAVVNIPILDPPIQAVGRESGEATKRAQWRLLQMGFWLAEPNGEYDLTTSQAVTAFQKYFGLQRDGLLGPETADAMSKVTIRPHGRTDSGTMMEVDKAKQLLFMVKDGTTQWVVNISSGSEVPYDYADKKRPGERQKGDAVTRNGLHQIYRENPDGWWDGDLGKIYRPKYFTGGIAFHGYNNVPPQPASHGCVRISLPAMDWIWENELMPMGTPVWVHEGSPEEYDSVLDVQQRMGITPETAPATSVPSN